MPWLIVIALGVAAVSGAQETGSLRVQVTHEGRPVAGALVNAGDRTAVTGASGEASLVLPAGPIRVEVGREGLETESADVTIRPQARTDLMVELHAAVELEEEVIVSATRSGRRVQDQALRVEVLAREEIEEKLLMTPGDVAMLLNETSGLRVQVASPSLGAANVRIQGLRGRYTQILADGLPLYGGQTGSIGLL